MRDTVLWTKWQGMKQRCNNPKSNVFKYYGGRGITVCKEWEHSYEAFRDWSLANGYERGLTIDRIDNDKGYFPENCRWVTMLEQKRNKRNTHWITVNGETKSLTEWAKESDIFPGTIYRRIKEGKTGEDLIKPYGYPSKCWGKDPVIKLIGGQDDAGI